jgi:hypothetical protein
LKTANLSKEDIEKQKKDQKKILDEIKGLEKELDKLIKKTNITTSEKIKNEDVKNDDNSE